MALRRPPTRIELKADDVEEYDRIMKERRQIAEQQALRQNFIHQGVQYHHQQQRQQQQQQQPLQQDEGGARGTGLLGASPSSLLSSQKKKPSAADRIGYRRNPR